MAEGVRVLHDLDQSRWRRLSGIQAFKALVSPMRIQVTGSEGRTGAIIGVGSCGLVLGSLLGGLHLLWVVLVAGGGAQPLMDFIFWLHFI